MSSNPIVFRSRKRLHEMKELMYVRFIRNTMKEFRKLEEKYDELEEKNNELNTRNEMLEEKQQQLEKQNDELTKDNDKFKMFFVCSLPLLLFGVICIVI